MEPKHRFWVGAACAAIVFGLGAWEVFGMPALKLAPQPSIWIRAAFCLGVLLFVASGLTRLFRQRVD